MKLSATDIRTNEKLRGAIIQERHVRKSERFSSRRARANTTTNNINTEAGSSSEGEESSAHEYSFYSSDNSGEFVVALNTSRSFVRDDRVVNGVKWRPAGKPSSLSLFPIMTKRPCTHALHSAVCSVDEYVQPARFYSKDMQVPYFALHFPKWGQVIKQQ